MWQNMLIYFPMSYWVNVSVMHTAHTCLSSVRVCVCGGCRDTTIIRLVQQRSECVRSLLEWFLTFMFTANSLWLNRFNEYQIPPNHATGDPDLDTNQKAVEMRKKIVFLLGHRNNIFFYFIWIIFFLVCFTTVWRMNNYNFFAYKWICLIYLHVSYLNTRFGW